MDAKRRLRRQRDVIKGDRDEEAAPPRPAEPEDGALAGVENLGGADQGQGSERREFSFESESAHETAELHGGILALAPALPVEPAQIGAGHADLVGALEQGSEMSRIH